MRSSNEKRDPDIVANFFLNQPVSFHSLSQKYPWFKKSVSNGKVDYLKSESLVALTKVLLLHFFQINWDLKGSNLCPPVPKSLNYIKFVNDLLIQTNNITKKSIIGVDIGTGASCIYPLLGKRCYNWNFVATDISLQSLTFAQENIFANKEYKESIKLVHVKNKKNTLYPNILPDEIKQFDFCMCNPPFFKDEIEGKRDNPKRICIAKKDELITEGGEEQFIKQIVDDSLVLKRRITWYTSLVGKKKTISAIKKYLTKKDVKNNCVGELIQGKTRRWVIAWNFLNESLYLSSTKVNIRVNIKSNIEIHKKMKFLFEKLKLKYKILSSGGYKIVLNKYEELEINILQYQVNSFMVSMETNLKFVTLKFQKLYEIIGKLF